MAFGLLYDPTAQTVPAVDANAATPFSSLMPPGSGFGLGTTLQRVPTQRSTSVTRPPEDTWRVPTAHASLVTGAATPRSAWLRANLGCAASAQALPSQRRMMLRYVDGFVLKLTTLPTAQT